ncbi:Transposase family Tnp2 protein [Ceratobasidium sp. AG-Ba]|nr:Transposase family Tnp2 protein [Ceratobasidium sp. AG-Ba]
MAELMQHWRHEGDEPDEEAEPLRWQDWINQTPPNRRFGDMSEAWGWRTQTAGLKRTYDGETYADYQVGQHPLSLTVVFQHVHRTHEDGNRYPVVVMYG